MHIIDLPFIWSDAWTLFERLMNVREEKVDLTFVYKRNNITRQTFSNHSRKNSDISDVPYPSQKRNIDSTSI